MKLTIDNQLVTLAICARPGRTGQVISGDERERRIAESRELIEDVVAAASRSTASTRVSVSLASVRISDDELAHLQENLVRSHAVGVGEDLDDDIVRLIMLMKVIALAEGFSGVRVNWSRRCAT